VTPTPTPTLTPSATPTLAPAAGYWRFEEGSGTAVKDGSGFGNNGVAENGMAWGGGLIGGGGIFDGVATQVRIANSASMNVTGTGLTLAAWIRPTAVDSYRVLLHKEQQYSLAISNGALTYADSITWSYAAIGSYGSVPVGVWSHVAVTFDGSTLFFYVNGVQVGSKARSGVLTDTANPVCLAAYNCVGFRFGGTLDEALVYPRPLTPAEVQALAVIPPTPTPTPVPAIGLWRFDDGSGTLVRDSSTLGNNGVAENGMGWGSGRIGAGGVFDGNLAQVRVSNSVSLNIAGTGLSLAAWVRPTATDGYRVIIHKEQQYSLAISDGAITYADSATWSYASIGSYGSVPAGVWSHVAVTFDGSMLRFYVNGVQVGSRARGGSLTTTSNVVCLAAYNCLGLRFAGTLDEVNVFQRPLSVAEIQTAAGVSGSVAAGSAVGAVPLFVSVMQPDAQRGSRAIASQRRAVQLRNESVHASASPTPTPTSTPLVRSAS